MDELIAMKYHDRVRYHDSNHMVRVGGVAGGLVTSGGRCRGTAGAEAHMLCLVFAGGPSWHHPRCGAPRLCLTSQHPGVHRVEFTQLRSLLGHFWVTRS
jgi:hypothetical protein